MKIDSLLPLLEQLALKSPLKSKYAAVLVHRGKVVSCGFNDFKDQVRSIHTCSLLSSDENYCSLRN